jgi:hypothetical protein
MNSQARTPSARLGGREKLGSETCPAAWICTVVHMHGNHPTTGRGPFSITNREIFLCAEVVAPQGVGTVVRMCGLAAFIQKRFSRVHYLPHIRHDPNGLTDFT